MDFNFNALAVTKSAESNRPYTVCAEKDGHKLAVSVALEPMKTVVGKKYYVALTLCVRFIEILKTEYIKGSEEVYKEGCKEYTKFGEAFAVREHFCHPFDGQDRVALRLAKINCPLVALPSSPSEVVKALESNDVFGQLATRIEAAVAACGGTLLAQGETLKMALAMPLESVLHMELPEVKFSIPEFK